MTMTIKDQKLFSYTKPPMSVWSWASWTKNSHPQSLLQMTLTIDYVLFFWQNMQLTLLTNLYLVASKKSSEWLTDQSIFQEVISSDSLGHLK
jgi:hypothetical protein